MLEVTYNSAMQPLVSVTVGGQPLRLVFDASSGNTIVFVREYDACLPASLEECYSYTQAEHRGTLRVCEENNAQMDCETRTGAGYPCSAYLKTLAEAKEHPDALIIDGVEYDQKAVEAKDEVAMTLAGTHGKTYNWSNMPVRLLVEAMRVPTAHSWVSLQLFEGAGGILGASGPSLSCRNQTLWSSLLQEQHVSRFALDFHPPPNATVQEEGPSRLVLNEIDPRFAGDVVWSQPKQTGDLINDGMHEFLLYHLAVCGVDLLYNTSSNWLAVIDTSGPCLMLPPFLFDRLVTRVPVSCPFAHGEKSLGRLCSPRRDHAGAKLPSLSFRLEDTREPMPRALHLPLERLVFRNGSGAELLCVARDDSDPGKATADMMYSHVALGSLVMAGLYTVVDLENSTVGLASRGHVGEEASEASCIRSKSCVGMQTYYPPQNLCEDPQCSDYMFMTLDDVSRTCRWTSAVPVAFGVLLTVLVLLDLISHRLYKQAIEKASEFCQ